MPVFEKLGRRSRAYFTQLRGETARSNLAMLRRVSVSFGLFLLIYGLLARVLFRSADLNRYYVLFFLLNLPCLVLFLWYGRRDEPSYPLVQGLCFLTVALVLGFTVCISLFPFPDRPSIFFPLAYMLVTVLFILPLWQIALELTLGTALYLAGVFLVKTPDAAAYDVIGAVTTWALGFFFLYWVGDLRLRDGEVRLELERICRTDALTGLPNRRAMEEELVRGYRRCQKLRLPVSIAMLDIDDFKSLNDCFGHLEGDRCLAALGGALRDFAAELGLFAARYGGEEFVLYMPGCGEAEGFETAGELLTRIRAAGISAPGGRPLTVSIGVAAEVPPEDGACAALLKRADAALYRAKTDGKDRVAEETGAAGPLFRGDYR